MFDIDSQIDHIIDVRESIPMGELVILTGGNGKGKSLIRKQMPFAVRDGFPDEIDDKKILHCCRSVSMQLRTESRPEFGALASMSHDLPWLPTSTSTYHSIKQLFKSLEDLDDGERYYLIIDEPEIGMSGESQLGIARFILEQFRHYKEHLYGLLLITHAEIIVRELKDVAVFKNLDGIFTADEWLSRDLIPTDFETLREESSALFRALEDRMKGKD